MLPPVNGEARPARFGRSLRWLLQLALASAAVWLIWRTLSGVSWRDLRALLAGAAPGYTALGIVLLVARFAIWSHRWRLALRFLGPLPGVWTSFFSIVASACANAFTPTGVVVGGLLRGRHLAGGGDRTFGRVYGVVLFDQLAHQTVIGLTGWLAFVGLALLYHRTLLAASAAAALLVAAAAGSYALRWLDEERIERLGAWLDRRPWTGSQGVLQTLHAHGRDSLRVMRQLLRDASLRRAALLLGVVYALVQALALWALFRAIDRPADLLTAWVAVTVGVMAGGFTGTPGGVGTTEAGMVLSLRAMEVGELEALGATLLFRGLHYLVVLALGLPALVFLEARRPGREARKEER
jgi:uncharacterized protein (TIRG00374 family)